MRLSVIIPVYNAELYLKTMIDSILIQDFEDYEMLLVDDGSTDESGKICNCYAAANFRIKVFHKKNGGVSNARNFGLQKARGEYVHFADSDDFIEKGMYYAFNKVVKAENPDIVMCGSKQINIKKNISNIIGPKQDDWLCSRDDIKNYLNGIALSEMKCLIHYCWNKWYKREWMLENKLCFNSELSLGEDYVFNCQILCTISSLYIIKQPYYNYYIRGNSLVSAFQQEPWKSRLMLLDAHIALYKLYGIWKEKKDIILLEEGKMCFVALRSVNSHRCQLNKREKQKFLKKMYDSYQMQLICFYLENSSKKLHRMWLFLINTWGLHGVEIVLIFDRIQRKWDAKK